MTTPAIARKQKIFAVKETTVGTLAHPASSNFIIGAGYASIIQQPNFTDSEEVVNTRDVIDRFQDRFGPGEWEIPHYARPSGSAGTAPQADVLYECLYGTKTVNGGTSVVYSQALEKPSFSLWLLKDHTLLWARGCTVSKMTAELASTGAFMFTSTGGFMEMGWVGTDTLNGGEPSAEVNIVVDNPKRFKAGGKVEFVESGTVYNNTSSGYTISSVNVSTNTVVITPGLETDLDDASTIRPFLPAGTVVGDPVESRLGKAVVDSVDTEIKSMTLDIGDEVQYLEDEITTTEYPESYAEDTREITGELALYFRERDAKYFYDGQNNLVVPVKMVAGATAGSIVEIENPYTSLEVPALEEDNPTVAITMNIKSIGSSGEDSSTLTFK
jgi:hypothetical protein